MNCGLHWLPLRLSQNASGRRSSDPEAGPRFLDRMVTEVDALTQMAQELLDLSRIESGQVALELSSLSPNNLLQVAADRMKLQAERSGLALRVEGAQDMPNVHGDQSRLEQVLVNLIHNAVKFTRPGGEVVLSAKTVADDGTSNGAVRFAVKDTGVEFPLTIYRASSNAFTELINRARGAGPGWAYPLPGILWKRTADGFGRIVWKGREYLLLFDPERLNPILVFAYIRRIIAQH